MMLSMSLRVVGDNAMEMEGTSASSLVLPLKLLKEAHIGESIGVKTCRRRAMG